MSIDDEPHFDLFSSDGRSTPAYAVIAAAVIGQLFAAALSIGLLFWTSPWLAFGVTGLASAYLYHLAWEAALKQNGLFWRLSTAAVMTLIMLFAAAFLYLASR